MAMLVVDAGGSSLVVEFYVLATPEVKPDSSIHQDRCQLVTMRIHGGFIVLPL